MEENNYNLGVRPDVGEMFAAGIAYVVIPPDVDRSVYIKECYKTSTVSIFSEFNGVSNRVPIDTFTINFIEFPNTINELGSAVSFLLEPVHKRPIIVGLYNKQDSISNLREHQFRFKRELNGNFVEIAGSSKEKNLAISVNADEGGEITINVKSNDESGKVSVNVQGECEIVSLTDTTLKQYGKLSILTIDRNNEDQGTFEEHTPTGRHIISKEEKLDTEKLLINGGSENFILGQLFKAFLQDFVKEVSNATVATPQGKMPLLNKLQIAEYAKDEKIDKFLSVIGFIDR